MTSEKDVQIFCCGVTQNALASGKFDIEDIPRIADTAYDWFVGKFGKPTTEAAPAVSFAPSASGGPQKPNWQGAVQALASGEGDIAPETKSFSLWGGDAAYLYGRDKTTWAELLGEAQDGNQKTIGELKKAAAAGLGKDPQWHKNNARRISRAKACLQMLQGQG